ncbi:hypothetical protein [Deinococcus arcticus]|uniref:Uncharacterized protein n=1 Tax=Deinococcus arcticus TaxID=2136176 RepID=A0A2T3W3C3_9DEIO|nr:hypothetical protein [Deinococcus arcticus]PTA66396.1 hypothetical protein C8263_18155 [Deinococcus arcticus]
MRRRAWLVSLTLTACAPAVQSPDRAMDLSPQATQNVLGSFSAAFATLGLQVQTVRGTVTTPSTDEALLDVVRRFKEGAPGFCPLAQQSFFTDASGQQFLTVLGLGQEVTFLIYDRLNPAGLISVTGRGTVRSPVGVKTCR